MISPATERSQVCLQDFIVLANKSYLLYRLVELVLLFMVNLIVIKTYIIIKNLIP